MEAAPQEDIKLILMNLFSTYLAIVFIYFMSKILSKALFVMKLRYKENPSNEEEVKEVEITTKKYKKYIYQNFLLLVIIIVLSIVINGLFHN